MHSGAHWAVTACLFVGLAVSGCQSENAAAPGNEAPAGNETDKSTGPKPEPLDPPAGANPGRSQRTSEVGSSGHSDDASAGGDGVADATAVPEDTRDLLAFMNEEVAPRLGVPEERAALVVALSSLPDRVGAPFDARFSEVLRDLPEEGSVASTCKTCHVLHRLEYRAAHASTSEH